MINTNRIISVSNTWRIMSARLQSLKLFNCVQTNELWFHFKIILLQIIPLQIIYILKANT